MSRVVVIIHGAFYVNLADNKHKHKHKRIRQKAICTLKTSFFEKLENYDRQTGPTY